ncbi:glycosyltransferase [bacterium]|nr:glycosyltransferase [bacterium]
MNLTLGKKVLMLTSQHSANDGRVFHLEAKALRDAGYRVTLLAPFHGNEPEDTYGITIRTFRKPEKRGLQRRLFTMKSLIKMGLEEKPDIIHVLEVDAPLLAAALIKSVMQKRGKNTKIIFDSHEVWAYFFSNKMPIRLLKPLVRHLVIGWEDFALNRFIDGVITAHEIEENYYLWLNPYQPTRKMLTGVPLEDWGDPPKRTGEIKTIGHDGYFTLHRGMDIILGAFEKLASQFPEIKLLVAGDFQFDEDRNYFEAWADRTGLDNRVELCGWVNRSEILTYLDRMDVGIVANKPDVHSVRCFPANKLMYYTGRALPVVSTPAPLYKRFINRFGCGISIASFSSNALAKALAYMITHPEETRVMGKKGYEIAKSEFGWKKAKAEMLALYKEVDTI